MVIPMPFEPFQTQRVLESFSSSHDYTCVIARIVAARHHTRIRARDPVPMTTRFQ
jgi:hypothetical protein